MKQTPVRTLEIVWLIATLLSFLAGIHKTYFHGLTNSYPFFIIFLLSLLMYINRRNLRKSQ